MENSVENNEIRNVIIIGSGPSGYTAALYAARANLSPLLIAGSFDPVTTRIKGGQLMFTSDIENFPAAVELPGFDTEHVDKLSSEDEAKAIAELKGVSGPNLMKRMELQARHFGTEMLEEFVEEVDICSAPGKYYTVKTQSGQSFKTRALIIATGASARRLGIDAEAHFFGQGGGVSTCATCDGNSYRGKTVAVVGGGDSAMEEASYLARIVDKVYVIHRREEFRASRIMLKRAQDNPKIEFILNAAIEDIKGKAHPLGETIRFYQEKEVVAGAVLKDTQTGESRVLPLDGIFIAIGHTPNSGQFKNQLKMDEAGYIEHDGRMRAMPSINCTNPSMRALEYVPGVFVAGDVSDHTYRQAITAAGMGCQAAIEAERYLADALAEEKGLNPESIDLSPESIAQSHWSVERDSGEKPMLERIEDTAIAKAECDSKVAETAKAEAIA